MKRLLEQFPIVVNIPVAWGEMDAFQHVNNAVFFKYFESARVAYFEKLAFAEHFEQSGIGPILASTQCRFMMPLTYPDTVSVGARMDSVAEDRFTMCFRVVSQRHRRIAAEGEGLIVVFDYRENRKAPVPDDLRNRIIGLERSVKPSAGVIPT